MTRNEALNIIGQALVTMCEECYTFDENYMVTEEYRDEFNAINAAFKAIIDNRFDPVV